MSPEAISLHEATGLDTWEEIGFAEPGSEQFPKQIEALRVEALARMGRQAPIRIWLPEDQVLRRQLAIRDSGTATRRNRAADLIEAETLYKRSEIELAVSPKAVDGRAEVLAILSQTRREAEDYARKWGFEPGDVTVRDPGERFAENASFASADGASQRVARAGLRWGTITAGLIGAGAATALGVWGLALAVKTQPNGPLIQLAIAEIGGGPATRDAVPAGASPFGSQPETGMAHGLAWPAGRVAAIELAPPYDLGWLATFTPPVRASVPNYQPTDDRLFIGKSPESSDLPVVLASLDTQATNFLRDAGVQEPAITEAVVASLAPVADAPISAPLPFPKSEPETETAATEGTDGPTAAGAIAWSADLDLPKPIARPASLSGILALPAADPEADTIDAAVAALPTPVGAETALTPATEEAGTSGDPEATLGPVLALAPLPKPKPEPKLDVSTLPAARALVPRSIKLDGPVSRSVSRAAKRQGLPLDRTSLIGIINVGTNREALLRLPNGRFRRIGQGDTLDGWK
ncbi:MAG: hypothetical protein AAF501_12230, partial [Pseudomonadota bacterium]